MKIYYTLKEYEKNIENDLNHFLDYEDNTECDFWVLQKELYKKCIISAGYVTAGMILSDVGTAGNPNIIYEVYNKVRDENSTYNLEYAENLKRSFEKILILIENINNPNIEEASENEMFGVLDKIRKNNYSIFELTKILKDLSNNYEIDLLQSILKDIEFYLFVEKDIMESEFSQQDFKNAIQRLTENNIEIPYHKRIPVESLNDKQKENRKKLEKKGLFSNPTINSEQLLFPFEFINIYSFRNIINSKLKPQQPEPLNLSSNLKQERKEVFSNDNYNVISTPQNNIDSFLYNDLHIEIFESAECRLSDYDISTLEYFNLLFTEFNFFSENINDYLKIKEHFVIPDFNTISIDDKEINFKNYLYYHLYQLIKYHFPIDDRKGVVKKCCERFGLVHSLISSFVFGTLNKHEPSTFEILKESIEGLEPKEQLSQLINAKFEILQNPNYYTESKNELKSFTENINFEIERIESLLKIETNQPQQLKNETSTIEKAKPKKLKKVLFQFIHNIQDKEGFIKELKETFPTEIGKSIKAIIDILANDKILVYGTKEFKTLYDEIKLNFNRDIGSYNSVQNVKTVDKETSETVYKKLNPLTIKYKIS